MWARAMFTPHSTYPPWAAAGLPCYFWRLHRFRQLWRIASATRGTWHCPPSVAGLMSQLQSRLTPATLQPTMSPAPSHHSHGSVMTPPILKDIQIISKSLLQGWHSHLQLSVITNNMPRCCGHSERPQIFGHRIARRISFSKTSTLTLPPSIKREHGLLPSKQPQLQPSEDGWACCHEGGGEFFYREGSYETRGSQGFHWCYEGLFTLNLIKALAFEKPQLTLF